MEEIRAFSPTEKAQAILVVDDDVQVLKFVARMLGSLGYDPVFQASSPEEALDVWCEHRPNIRLLVSDFVMPKVTGDHLALRLLNDQPQLRILFISGNDPASLDSAIPLEDGRNFLQKPFTLAEIKKTVANLNAAG